MPRLQRLGHERRECGPVHSHEPVRRPRGVEHRPEHVERRADAEGLPHGRDRGHRGVVAGGVEEGDARGVEAARGTDGAQVERHAHLLQQLKLEKGHSRLPRTRISMKRRVCMSCWCVGVLVCYWHYGLDN